MGGAGMSKGFRRGRRKEGDEIGAPVDTKKGKNQGLDIYSRLCSNPRDILHQHVICEQLGFNVFLVLSDSSIIYYLILPDDVILRGMNYDARKGECHNMIHENGSLIR